MITSSNASIFLTNLKKMGIDGKIDFTVEEPKKTLKTCFSDGITEKTR